MLQWWSEHSGVVLTPSVWWCWSKHFCPKEAEGLAGLCCGDVNAQKTHSSPHMPDRVTTPHPSRCQSLQRGCFPSIFAGKISFLNFYFTWNVSIQSKKIHLSALNCIGTINIVCRPHILHQYQNIISSLKFSSFSYPRWKTEMTFRLALVAGMYFSFLAGSVHEWSISGDITLALATVAIDCLILPNFQNDT